MAEFSPQRVISMIEHNSVPQAFGSFNVASKIPSRQTTPTTGFVKQTAIYNPTMKGVVTSDQQFFKTRDPNWRPEGYVDLGMQRIKGRGGVMGGQVSGGIPKPKVYNAFSSYFLETMPDKEGVVTQKSDAGIITQIMKPSTEYQSQWRVDSKGKTQRQTSTYVPYEVKFDEKGNIVSETQRSIMDSYEKSGKIIQRSPYETNVKTYGDNTLMNEKIYDLRTREGDTGTITKTPVATTELDWKNLIQTTTPMTNRYAVKQAPLTDAQKQRQYDIYAKPLISKGKSVQAYDTYWGTSQSSKATPEAQISSKITSYLKTGKYETDAILGKQQSEKIDKLQQDRRNQQMFQMEVNRLKKINTSIIPIDTSNVDFSKVTIGTGTSSPTKIDLGGGNVIGLGGAKLSGDISYNRKIFSNKTNKIQKMLRRMI